MIDFLPVLISEPDPGGSKINLANVESNIFGDVIVESSRNSLWIDSEI